MPTTTYVSDRNGFYDRAVAEYGGAIARLTRGYEADPEKRRDLLQEIHLALWRSFENFDERCSLRTWVYRVAHNTAVSWTIQQKRARPQTFISLDEIDAIAVQPDADRQVALDRLIELIRNLKPLDRQVILLYLEGLDAADIGELTGISPANTATKVHRIKSMLARKFNAGMSHAE